MPGPQNLPELAPGATWTRSGARVCHTAGRRSVEGLALSCHTAYPTKPTGAVGKTPWTTPPVLGGLSMPLGRTRPRPSAPKPDGRPSARPERRSRAGVSVLPVVSRSARANSHPLLMATEAEWLASRRGLNGSNESSSMPRSSRSTGRRWRPTPRRGPTGHAGNSPKRSWPRPRRSIRPRTSVSVRPRVTRSRSASPRGPTDGRACAKRFASSTPRAPWTSSPPGGTGPARGRDGPELPVAGPDPAGGGKEAGQHD